MRAIALVLLVALAVRADDRPPKIGDTIANLQFKDIRYLPRSLNDFKDRKAFVLVFSTTSCPLVQRYWPVLNRLEKDYRDRGVQFIALNVGADDSITTMAAQAVKHDCAFPFVKDFDAVCARALGVERTPQVVVLDAQKELRYRGRIDDQYRLGGNRPAPTRHDLKEAIDAVLAGREVTVSETPVDGCLITRTEITPSKTPITYAEHVAPLLRKHCIECHRPGTAAPFSLVTYEQAASKANTIAEAVHDQRMPPWYGSPDHKEFVNRRGLTAREREMIQLWVLGGKPRGDDSRLPPVNLPKPDSWKIGQPDIILQAEEHELPAEGLIPYRHVFLTHVFKQDTWIQGAQIRPDNPRVLHHCNMGYVTLGEGFKISNFITGLVPGGEAMTLENGVGYRIPKGALLVLQVHYVTTGKPEKCRLSVGFKYASGKIQQQLRFSYLADTKYTIPPGAPAHRVSTSRVLEHDAEGVGLFCHMHVRGRDMTFKAHYPDNKSETLLVIPNYNFDWQMPYRWAPGTKKLPKGTRLECIAHYDNSAFNPFNPDPKATVKDGPQTHNEMLNGFVFYIDTNERLGLDIDGKTGTPK
jgi:thiol-disulfide isomerase/thioredoxin